MPDDVTDMAALRAIVDERHHANLREFERTNQSLVRFGERLGTVETSAKQITDDVAGIRTQLDAIEHKMDGMDNVSMFVTNIQNKLTWKWIFGAIAASFGFLTVAITLGLRVADVWARIH